MDRNESLLWNSFKDGDPNALFSIYEFLYKDLLRCGLSVTPDRDLVKDTINQFFLYLWDKRANLNTPENLKFYILVSFKRKLVNEINSSKKAEALLLNEPVPEQSYEDNLVQIQSDLELQLKVRRAIEKLPPRQQELIMLKYYEGLSYREISDKTALSMRTVYNKLHEAIKSLKKNLLSIILFSGF